MAKNLKIHGKYDKICNHNYSNTKQPNRSFVRSLLWAQVQKYKQLHGDMIEYIAQRI